MSRLRQACVIAVSVLVSMAATSAQVSATTPGLDVSHHQGAVDWSAVAGAGAKFAFMKATEGTTYTDPQFTANYSGSANAGLRRGAYHFALPDRSGGVAQALFFLDHGGGWVADGHTLPPVLDIEYNPYGTADWAGWCYGLTTTQMSAWIADFATTVHDRTNRWPIIYTTTGWWSHCTGNDSGFGNDPLWIAPSNSDAGGAPTIPASWSEYTFFQYATSGTFPGDQDWFNGTPEQLAAFATGDEPDKLQAHYSALGGAASPLGNVSGGEYTVAGGWAQNYDHGTMYFRPSTGAWSVRGAILGHYQNLGGPGGLLGFPLTDETPVDGGSYNDFAGADSASIYWSTATGARSVHGQIRSTWLARGGTQVLGFPTTDESTTPDGVGRYNHFNGAGGASVYWTPSTGAHSVQGQIRSRWAALGWETGAMGYPATDETAAPDGVGRYNHFSKAASIYWSPTTGAWSVYGAIRDTWASLGWERSALGYPTSDEYAVTGGRRTNFQHGTIAWDSATGRTQVAYS